MAELSCLGLDGVVWARMAGIARNGRMAAVSLIFRFSVRRIRSFLREELDWIPLLSLR